MVVSDAERREGDFDREVGESKRFAAVSFGTPRQRRPIFREEWVFAVGQEREDVTFDSDILLCEGSAGKEFWGVW